MPTFEVYVDDDRYQVPSLYLITANDEARAKDLAVGLWRESRHHRGVELHLGGERIFGGGTMDTAKPAACGQEQTPHT